MMLSRAFLLLGICLNLSSARSSFDDDLELKVNIVSTDGVPLDPNSAVTINVIRAFDGKRLQMHGSPTSLPEHPETFVAHIGKATADDDNAVQVTDKYWQIEVSEPRYVTTYIGPIRLKETTNAIVASDGDMIGTVIVRDPAYWRANFQCSLDLFKKPDFKVLGALLAKPGDVYLRKKSFFGTKWTNLGNLADSNFSDPVSEPDDTLDRARAALLNIYHSLMTDSEDRCVGGAQGDWFQYVTAIHVLDEERVITRVDPEMYDRVVAQAKQYPQFACNLSFSAPATLHHFEDPRSTFWDGKKMPNPVEVTSIKTPICQGNVQITVGRFRSEGKVSEVLADFDIDEHLAFLLHSGDVARHAATGRGTNAYEMREMLAVLHRNLEIQAGHPIIPVMLGYSLVSKTEKRTASCRDSSRTPLRSAR
jgi:hypothetical protein